MTAPVQELPEPQQDTCMAEAVAVNTVKKKKRAGPKSRTSPYVGVSQYKRTGRWEAHLWDPGDGPTSKGRQLHLGSFKTSTQAAKAYDRLALVLKGSDADINFPAAQYDLDPLYVRLTQLSSKKSMVMAIRATQDQDEDDTTMEQQQQLQQNRDAGGAAAAGHVPPYGPATPVAAEDLPETPVHSVVLASAAGEREAAEAAGGAAAGAASAGVQRGLGRRQAPGRRTKPRGRAAASKEAEEGWAGGVRRSSRIAAATAAEARTARAASAQPSRRAPRTAPAASLSPAIGQSRAGSQGPSPRQQRTSPGASDSVGPAAAPLSSGVDTAASGEEQAWGAAAQAPRLPPAGHRQAGRPRGLQEATSGDSSSRNKRTMDGSCQEAAQGMKFKLQKQGSAAADTEPEPELPPRPSPEPDASVPSAGPVDQRAEAGGTPRLRGVGKGSITGRPLGPVGSSKSSAGVGPHGQMGVDKGQSAGPALGPGGLDLGLVAGAPVGSAGLGVGSLAVRAQALTPPPPAAGMPASSLVHRAGSPEPSQFLGLSDLSSMAVPAAGGGAAATACKQEVTGTTAAPYSRQPADFNHRTPPSTQPPAHPPLQHWGSLPAAQQAGPVAAPARAAQSVAPAPAVIVPPVSFSQAAPASVVPPASFTQRSTAAIVPPTSFTQAAPALLPGAYVMPALFPGTPPMQPLSPATTPSPPPHQQPAAVLPLPLSASAWDLPGAMNILSRKQAKGQAATTARLDCFPSQPAVSPATAAMAAADAAVVPAPSPDTAATDAGAGAAGAAPSDEVCNTLYTLPLVTTSITLGGAFDQTGQRQSSPEDSQRPGSEVKSPGLLCGPAALSSHWMDTGLWGPGGSGREEGLLGGGDDLDRLLTEEQEQRMEEREEMDMMVRLMLE